MDVLREKVFMGPLHSQGNHVPSRAGGKPDWETMVMEALSLVFTVNDMADG